MLWVLPMCDFFGEDPFVSPLGLLWVVALKQIFTCGISLRCVHHSKTKPAVIEISAAGSIQFFGGLAVIARKLWLKTHSFAPPAFAGFAFIETYVLTTWSIVCRT
jgi:hypothetical protein